MIVRQYSYDGILKEQLCAQGTVERRLQRAGETDIDLSVCQRFHLLWSAHLKER